MNDEEKTNEQLIKELEELRRRVKRFESRDAERKRIQKELEQHRRSLAEMVMARTAKLTKANEQLQQEITERKKQEKALEQRHLELALINRACQSFISSLDLDQIIGTVLEEVRHLLGVTSWSAWLLDPETQELVCTHVTDPDAESVRGWRLGLGQGVAGWVTLNKKSLIVNDTRTDNRHYKLVDQRIGVEMRSIMSVPLRIHDRAIGALQVVDTEANRFNEADLRLLEPLAATAAIAIENAWLYEEATQDLNGRQELEEELSP
jgi:transcriptional regulator with GAF, ATPase, and Fis domain